MKKRPFDWTRTGFTDEQVKQIEVILDQKEKFDDVYFEKEMEEKYISKDKYTELESKLKPFEEAEHNKVISSSADKYGIKWDEFKELKASDKFSDLLKDKKETELETFVKELKSSKPALFKTAPAAPELNKSKPKVVETPPKTEIKEVTPQIDVTDL